MRRLTWSASPRSIALPSVVLMMMFGQTRVFFVMARDGLLPDRARDGSPALQDALCRDRRSPASFGADLAAAFLPVGKLADYSNSGTLFAFAMVAARRDGACASRIRTVTGRSVRRRSGSSRRWRSSAASSCSSASTSTSKLVFVGLGGDRPGGLFPLQPPAQPCRPRHRRGAGAVA